MRAYLLGCLLLVGCQSSGSGEGLTVFAASSLTEAFGELESGFERAHPGVDVRLSFAGSQVLRLQLEQGAPADVFASANPEHIQAVVDGGLVREERVFARNALVVIVPPDNPAGIGRFADLSRAERLVIGTRDVPIGVYTRELFERAGPELQSGALSSVVSEESNVRLVRAKVEMGEADAAIVYRSDALNTEGIEMVEIPEDINVSADYHVGITAASGHLESARSWITYISSDEGQDVLKKHGFAGP